MVGVEPRAPPGAASALHSTLPEHNLAAMPGQVLFVDKFGPTFITVWWLLCSSPSAVRVLCRTTGWLSRRTCANSRHMIVESYALEKK